MWAGKRARGRQRYANLPAAQAAFAEWPGSSPPNCGGAETQDPGSSRNYLANAHPDQLVSVAVATTWQGATYQGQIVCMPGAEGALSPPPRQRLRQRPDRSQRRYQDKSQ